MSKSEKKVEKAIKDYIKKEYPTAFLTKIHGSMYQSSGLPDLIACINGQFVGIEVKAPGKEKNLTEIQKNKLEGIRKSGGVAFMASSVETVKEMLDRCLE